MGPGRLRGWSVLLALVAGTGCPDFSSGQDDLTGSSSGAPGTVGSGSSADTTGSSGSSSSSGGPGCPDALQGRRFGVCRFDLELKTGRLQGGRFGTNGNIGHAEEGVVNGNTYGVRTGSGGGQ